MRLIGINIPDNKRIEIALSYIYGIGQSSAGKILKEASIDVNKRTRDLSAEEVNKIQSILERTYKIEGELRQKIRQNINRLKEIKCYRGLRHLRRLPVRGQRTRTNSRTVRGNVRKTISSGRRKVGLK